jgi:hypothetical protein
MTGGVAKVDTPLEDLISIKSSRYDFTDFKAKVGWFEHFEAVGMVQKLTYEVGRGSYVDGKICVFVSL